MTSRQPEARGPSTSSHGRRRDGMERANLHIEDLCEVEVGSHRSRAQAREIVSPLLVLMGWHGDSSPLGPEVEEALLRYCMDVPLNISWYEKELARLRRRLQKFVSWSIAAGILVIALALAIPLIGIFFHQKPELITTIAADVVLIVMGLGGIGQVLASRSDLRAQVAGFWSASSDLKEQLFDFVETWRGKLAAVCPEPGKPPSDPAVLGAIRAELRVALAQELKEARKIVRQERAAFLATFRAPSEVLSLVTSTFETLRGKQTESLVAQKGLLHPDAQTNAVTAARRALLEATASVQSARALEDGLKAAGADADQGALRDARMAFIRAEAEVVKAKAILESVVRT